MRFLLTFERFKALKSKKWRRKIPKHKMMHSRKPVLEPLNPDEMTPSREYDQTDIPIPGNVMVKV